MLYSCDTDSDTVNTSLQKKHYPKGRAQGCTNNVLLLYHVLMGKWNIINSLHILQFWTDLLWVI